MEQTIGTLAVRVDKLEKDVCELFDKANSGAVLQATISEKLNSVLVTLGEVKGGLSSLQQVPAKRWENLIGYVLSAAISAGITYLILK